MSLDFEQRCNIAAACLPKADYRTQLEKLHAEMLAALAVRAPASQGLTPADRFEDAIREVGIVFACEWFGHAKDSEFTQETIRVLSERAAIKDAP